MDARLLVQLAAVVESGSLRRAAARLQITQPTLTRNMKLLEDRIGSEVLRRTSKGVEPTLIGRRLSVRGQEILTTCSNAQETVNNWHKGQENPLRVGVGPFPAVTVMPEYLESQFGQNKIAPLHIQVGTPQNLVAMVDDGSIDVAIAAVQLNQHHSNLHQELLFEDRVSLMVRAEHPLAGMSETQLIDQLGYQEWIVVGSKGLDDGTGPILQQLGIQRQPPRLVLEGGINMAFHSIRSSDVVAALPIRLTRTHQIGRELKELRLSVALPRRDLALWMRPDDHEKREFIELASSLKTHLAAIVSDVPIP